MPFLIGAKIITNTVGKIKITLHKKDQHLQSIKSIGINIEGARLSYSQKPEKFTKDNEFRFIAIIMGRPGSRYNEDYLYINIGKRLEYTEIIKL